MVDKEEDYNWEKRYKEWKEIQSKLPESPVKEAPFYPNPEYDNKSIVEKTIASLKEDSQMFKEKIEQAEQSIEKALDLNNRPKLKLTLTILAYAIPAIILVGLLYYIFQPAINAESNIYNLDIGIKGDDSSRKALFLEKSKALSPHVLYGKETYREIIKTTPFEISFKSPVVIPPSSFVVLSLDVIGTNSNLYLNNTLVFPNLENYEFFKDLPDGYLFKKKSLTSDYLYEKDTLEEFLKENYYGTTIYSYIPLESEPIIENYAPTETFINNSFRNNLKFLFYTENSINLNFKKEDLNWYEGEDNYTVYIKDMDENIIYSEFLEDDFDATASNIKGFQQEHNLYFPGLKGVYYLIFENNGKSSDSTIKNIRINTNKIVYYRNFLVLNPMQFYIKNYFNKGLRFYYWHADAEQNIIINNQSFYLGKEYKEVNYDYPLSYGDYEVSVEKGDVSISSGFLVAPKKENWFDFPYIIQKQISDPDFIIFDNTQIEFTEEGFILSEKLPSMQEQKISLRADKKYQLKLRTAEVEIA